MSKLICKSAWKLIATSVRSVDCQVMFSWLPSELESYLSKCPKLERWWLYVLHNGLIFHWKLGNFFLQEYALYANIISISEKVKHLYREKEKYDLEMFVHAHWDIFFSGIWGNVDRAFSPNHWKKCTNCTKIILRYILSINLLLGNTTHPSSHQYTEKIMFVRP